LLLLELLLEVELLELAWEAAAPLLLLQPQ
jgi:hypothetical protein